MLQSTLNALSKANASRHVAYDHLMLRRVHNILLVSSPYDSFTFEEDGRLTELLFSEYLELNLRYAPNIVRVSTAKEALTALRGDSFDLVISMLRVGDMDVADFGREVDALDPELPVVLLTYNTRELTMLEDLSKLPGIDRVFVWLGDVRIFIAIIKYVEDRLNALDDSKTAGVNSIILVEDNVRFYSTYLPLFYTELVQQTQSLMSDGLNRLDKLLRMRARHKVLLATDYEEGVALYQTHMKHVAGVIVDASFPRDGKIDNTAGLAFAKFVKENTPDRPVLVQSSVESNRQKAHAIGARFINKQSASLLKNLRRFMRADMGFGDFIFRTASGEEIDKATDLRTLTEKLATIPTESLLYHVGRNDFSTWLMARTEFALAKMLRPRKVEEFNGPDDIRGYLVDKLIEHRDRSREGVVVDFSSATFDESIGIVRIGRGSLGGKGRGLAFMNKLLRRLESSKEDPSMRIKVPPAVVIATGVFDEFMQNEGLLDVAFTDDTDDGITQKFLAAPLPEVPRGELRTFLDRVHYPLAVRSSSLLEDASHQPFAGLYATFMIPNNHEDIEVRLHQLETAIKRVYASTFHEDARSYIQSTPNRLEEEKMAVVIQQVAGKKRDDCLYPDFAGVARSYDFYPMEGMLAEEGVAQIVLGLGKAVVDGGQCTRFSPAHPRNLYQFSSVKDALHNTQRDFLALDLSDPAVDVSVMTEESSLVKLGLDVAKKHNVLPYVGSVYSNDNDAIYDGTSRPGTPLVTFAGILKHEAYPLAQTLVRLLDLGVEGFSSQVEMEFACTLGNGMDKPHEFAFLQIRPIVVSSRSHDVSFDALDPKDAICFSQRALGNGLIEDVQDVIYVPMTQFSRIKTVEIARQIGEIAAGIRAAGRQFLLVGPGRWGSADHWLGIPVTWSQISGVACIVETDMADIRVTPSQGTHFFQNITSFGIGYFTVTADNSGGTLDLDWLDEQPAETETDLVRHLHFDRHLDIVVSAKKGTGVVMKPGKHLRASYID